MILLIFCAMSAFAAEYGDATCHLIRIIDGDTIKCDIPEYPPIVGSDISVRFKGINAPEIHGAEAEKGYISKAKLEKLLAGTDEITLRNISRDKYFRLDADIYVGETKINTPELIYP